MSEPNKQSLAISVGEHTFRIRALPEEAARYERVARIANDALAAVQNGPALSGPRAMAMALFQLAVEVDDARQGQDASGETRERLRRLIERIDQATEHTTS